MNVSQGYVLEMVHYLVYKKCSGLWLGYNVQVEALLRSRSPHRAVSARPQRREHRDGWFLEVPELAYWRNAIIALLFLFWYDFGGVKLGLRR